MPDLIRLQLLLATFAGWVNREQAQVVAYLVEENRVLQEQLRRRRLRLTDDQHRRSVRVGPTWLPRFVHRRGSWLLSRGTRAGPVFGQHGREARKVE